MRRMIVLGLAAALVVGACGAETSVTNIVAGDCFDDPPDFIVSSLELISCSEPHDNEVFANLVISQAVFPGDEVIRDFAFEACLEPFEDYVGESYQTSPLDYSYLGPTEESWNTQDDRTVTCILYAADLSKLTTTARQ